MMTHAWGCDVDRFKQYGQPADPTCTCVGVSDGVFTELERAIHAGIAPNWMTVARACGSQEHYNEFLHEVAASVLAAGFCATSTERIGPTELSSYSG